VISRVKFDEEDPIYVGLAGKWFWLRILAHVAVTGERCSSSVAPGEKSVRNMI